MVREADDALLRALVDRLPPMVAFWDRDLRNVFANAAYLAWLGIEPAQVHGMPLRDVMGEETFARSTPFLEKALAGEDQHFDRTLVGPDGRERHTQVSYLPHRVEGAVVGFFVVISDVTPMARAEQELRRSVVRYRALARSLPGSFVLVYDQDLRYLIADGPALAAFGLSRELMEGRTLFETLPERVAEVEGHYRAALEGVTTTWDRDLGDRILSLTAGPVLAEDGAVTAGMIIGIDVTADRRREARDRVMHAVARSAAGGAAMSDILDLVARGVLEVMRADHAAVLHFTSGGIAEIVAMAPGLPPTLADDPTFPLDDTTAAARVGVTGSPQVQTYDEHSTGAVRRVYELGVRTAAAAPIRVNGVLWGAMSLGLARTDVPTDEVLGLLADFADLLSISIGSADARARLERAAAVDPLTELPNRRAFDERLAGALSAASRDRRPVSVALLDLDHFKAVNDAAGHPTGDRVLRAAAQAMLAVTRGHDLLARVGGEEFGLLLFGADEHEALAAVERLRAAVEQEALAGHWVTVSGGVSTADAASVLPAELMERADRALYAAKRAGRNTIRSD